MIRVPLLSQANHATRQKSRSTGIVLTVFHWISLDECLQRRKELVNLYLTAYIMLWHKEASQLIGKNPKNYVMVLKNIELQNT